MTDVLELERLQEMPAEFVPDDYISIDLPATPDKAPDECGVAAIAHVNDSPSIAYDVSNGLAAVQHRGQEAAGVAVYVDEEDANLLKRPGLVTDALEPSALRKLGPGRMAVGQVRYGTIRGLEKTPKTLKKAAQPTRDISAIGSVISLCHNGTLPDAFEDHITDSHGLSAEIAQKRSDRHPIEDTVIDVLRKTKGAYSLTIMGEDKLIGVRDPFGFRPLMLGSYPDERGGYALASESHALEKMGAVFRRELARGEMVICTPDGRVESVFPFDKRPDKLCAMELIYLYGPQGELKGRSVHMVRKEMGKILAEEHPVDADVVIGVPDSGIPASEGYSLRADIPRVTGIMRDKYSQRTFIIPGQAERNAAVQKKIQLIMPEIHGRRVVVVDDSIVRGTTMKNLVAGLFRKGAAEVHLRISAPPIYNPCYYGMDFPDPAELVANQYASIDKVRKYLGATSLGYLSIEGLYEATNAAGKLCLACMDGNYPKGTGVKIKNRNS